MSSMKSEKEPLLTGSPDANNSYGTAHERESQSQSNLTNPPTLAFKSRPIKDLFRYADHWDKFLVVLGTIVSVFTGAGWPLMAAIFGQLSNTFITAQNSYTLTKFGTNMTLQGPNFTFVLPQITREEFIDQTIGACLDFTYLGCAILIAAYVQMSCWLTTCERQINKLRHGFFHAIMRQEIAWYDQNMSGMLISQLSDSLERVKEGIGDKFALLLQYSAQVISGFVIAFVYSWKLTLVMMSLSPLMAASSAFMTRLISTASRKEQEKYAIAGAIVEEVISNIRTVMAFNGQTNECNRYKAALEKGKKVGILKGLFTGLGMAVTFLVMFGSYGLAFWYGSALIMENSIERGTVFIVFFSVMMGSFALGNAGPQLTSLIIAKSAIANVLDIIDREPKIDAYTKNGKRLSDPKGRVEFDNVCFDYPSRPDVRVLNNVSFNVDPGQIVAIVGATGSGKSTLVKLLLRFYHQVSGNINIDDVPIEELNVRWLRNMIGVVSQEPVLFEGTVEENIKYGRQRINNKHIIAACRRANAHDFIVKLPDGYHTMVGERGTQLSGGQKQRIAIARALVRNPKILLLDEATSALDAQSESVVQEALEKAQQGRTTIVIAHRLSTVRNADKIIAMENGQIREVGTHFQLIDMKGLYYQLVTAQIIDPGSGYTSPTSDAGGAISPRDLTDGEEDWLSPLSSKRGSIVDPKRGSLASHISDNSETSISMRRTRRKRIMAKIDVEKERLKRDLREEGIQESNFSKILHECREQWRWLTVGFIASGLRGFVMPIFSYFYSEIFETYSHNGRQLTNGASFWAVMFVLLGVVEGTTWIVSAFAFAVASEKITFRIRMNVFQNVLRQDATYFDDPRHSTGRICIRLATDASNIRAAVDFRLANVFSASISMLSGIVLAFIFGWKMTLVVLAIFPFMALGGSIRMKLRQGSAKRDAALLEQAGKIAVEAIENIVTVQSLTREHTFYERFSQNLKLPYKEGLKQAHIQAVSYAFAQAIFFFMYAACFRFGGHLVSIDQMTPVAVYRVFFAVNFSGMAVGFATAYFPEYLKARRSAGLVFKMASDQPIIDNCSKAGLKPEVNGSVVINNVHFTYPARTETEVLKGISLQLEKGQTLALVGTSGCGKTTLVSLLERFYDPSEGNITIDGLDVRTLNIEYIRDHISLVSQEPVLFDCSISENITYGLTQIDHSHIVEAAQLANIHDFVSSLPLGYNTPVGQRGTQLSVGQKQRIAIARALVRNPQILLLDEATSALDTESEKIVQEALEQAGRGRTCIIVAHRLSTVQNADKIAVISDGRVAEIDKMMVNSSARYECKLPFTFECHQENCCESYHMRFIMLLCACAVIAFGIIVFLIWFFASFTRQQRRRSSTASSSIEDPEVVRIRLQNIQETKHLRRMSELKGLKPSVKGSM